MQILLSIIGDLLGLVAVVVGFVTFVIWLRLFRPKLISALPSFSFESVSFKSSDGLKLAGWWVVGKKSQPVVLLCHGVSKNRGDILPIAESLERAGFGLLLLDLRGHGESEGGMTSYGYYERLDVLAAVRFLSETGRLKGRELCLYGLSMGGASLLMAIRELKDFLGKKHVLRSVVIDSSFTRFKPIMEADFGNWPKWMQKTLVPIIRFVSVRFFRLPIKEINPIEEIKHIAPAKLLLIHSKTDDLIPIAHGKELYKAAKQPKTFWQIEKSEHADTFLNHPKKYTTELKKAFSEPSS